MSTSALCIRCFDYGKHTRQECKAKSVICCSSCFRLNYLTKHCCNSNRDVPDDEYPQTFRMVGVINTLFFIDIQVGKKFVAAKLNTNASISKMDFAVLNELTKQSDYKYSMNGPYVPLPICVDNIISNLQCEYRDLGKTLRLELGMDFMLKNSIELQLDNVILEPSYNGKSSKVKEARFHIQVAIGEKLYRAVIDTALTRSRIDLNTVLELDKTAPNDISFDLLGSTAEIKLKRHNKETVINFDIRGVDGANNIRLGIDFLKQRQFIFRFNGIELNINNPWKVSHPDAIDFAYNHELGNKLKYIIKHELEENTRRSILPKPILKPTAKAKQD